MLHHELVVDQGRRRATTQIEIKLHRFSKISQEGGWLLLIGSVSFFLRYKAVFNFIFSEMSCTIKFYFS